MSVETQKSAATPRREQAVTPARENAASSAGKQVGMPVKIEGDSLRETLDLLGALERVKPSTNLIGIGDRPGSVRTEPGKIQPNPKTLEEAIKRCDEDSRFFLLLEMKRGLEQGKYRLIDGPKAPGYIEKLLSAEIISHTLAVVAGRDPIELVFLRDIDIYLQDSCFSGGRGVSGVTIGGLLEQFLIKLDKNFLDLGAGAGDISLEYIRDFTDELTTRVGDPSGKLKHGIEALYKQFNACFKKNFSIVHEMIHYAQQRGGFLPSKDNANLVRGVLERITCWKEWESEDERASLEHFGYQSWDKALKEMPVALINHGAMLLLYIFEEQVESDVPAALGRIAVGEGLEEFLTCYLEQVCASIYEQLSRQGIVQQLRHHLANSPDVDLPSVGELLAQKGRNMNELVEQAVLQQEMPLAVQILSNNCGGLSQVVRNLYFNKYGFHNLVGSFDLRNGLPGSFLEFLMDCDEYMEFMNSEEWWGPDNFKRFSLFHENMEEWDTRS